MGSDHARRPARCAEPADADLIAHAPDDLRWLLDALAEAEVERDALSAKLAAAGAGEDA